MTKEEQNDIIGHLDDIISMARAIRRDVRKQTLEEVKSDLKCMGRRVETALNSPVFR